MWKRLTLKEIKKEYYNHKNVVALWKQGIYQVYIRRRKSYQETIFSKPSIRWDVEASTGNTLDDDNSLSVKKTKKEAISYAKAYMKAHSTFWKNPQIK